MIGGPARTPRSDLSTFRNHAPRQRAGAEADVVSHFVPDGSDPIACRIRRYHPTLASRDHPSERAIAISIILSASPSDCALPLTYASGHGALDAGIKYSTT
jgi:hypothetical protein